MFRDVEHRTADLADVRPVVGREAIAELCRAWLASTPEFAYEVDRVLDDGRSAAARWRYSVPGPAGTVEVEGITWIDCEGGEIREALVLFDSYRLLRGLERIPPV